MKTLLVKYLDANGKCNTVKLHSAKLDKNQIIRGFEKIKGQFISRSIPLDNCLVYGESN